MRRRPSSRSDPYTRLASRPAGENHLPGRNWLFFALGMCVALNGCDNASTFPLDLEVKDGVATPGAKWDEIQLLVKSLPGAEVRFGDQTKSMEGTRATEQFAVPKSGLKLGKNSFVVHAKTGALFSKK